MYRHEFIERPTQSYSLHNPLHIDKNLKHIQNSDGRNIIPKGFIKKNEWKKHFELMIWWSLMEDNGI